MLDLIKEKFSEFKENLDDLKAEERILIILIILLALVWNISIYLSE